MRRDNESIGIFAQQGFGASDFRMVENRKAADGHSHTRRRFAEAGEPSPLLHSGSRLCPAELPEEASEMPALRRVLSHRGHGRCRKAELAPCNHRSLWHRKEHKAGQTHCLMH